MLKVYSHVDRLFAITFVVDLPAHWVIADNRGNVHHVHHNQDLHNPKFVEGWTQLRNFYWLLGDHDILLAYVGGSCFQLTVFISEAREMATETFRQERDEKAHVFDGDLVHYKLTFYAQLYTEEFLVIYVHLFHSI